MFWLYRIREWVAQIRALFYRTFKYPIIRIREQYNILASYFRRAGQLRRHRGRTKKKRKALARRRRRAGLKPKKPPKAPVRDRQATFDVAARSLMLMAFVSVLLSLLLFYAGFLTGVRWTERAAAIAVSEDDADAEAASGGPETAGEAKSATSEALAGAAAESGGRAVGAKVGGKAGASLATGASTAAGAASGAVAGTVSAGASGAADQVEQIAALGNQPPSFTLRVGSFLVNEDAEAFVKLLADRGYQPEVQERRGVGERRVFTVVVGSYLTYPEAETAASAFAAREQIEAIATRLQQPDPGVI